MSKNRNALNASPGVGTRPVSRWFRIGPATIMALAISALLGAQWVRTQTAARPEANTPPIVERQIISASYDEKLGPTPEVSFIVDRAGKLRLTKAQLAGLVALHSKWQNVYSSKMADANRSAEQVGKCIADKSGGARTPVAQIQDAAAPVVALSGEISSARQSYWDQAVSLLDRHQRSDLQTEREADWSAKKASPAKAGQPEGN